MCSGCPFQAECAERGRTEEWGVWGGLTQWDRPSAAALAKEAEKDRKAARLAERNKRIRHYGRTGIYTAADIARDFNLSEQTVKGILAQEGRVRATGPKILDPAERAQRDGLIRSMRSHGKPVSQIAHEFSLTDGTVYAILRSA